MKKSPELDTRATCESGTLFDENRLLMNLSLQRRYLASKYDSCSINIHLSRQLEWKKLGTYLTVSNRRCVCWLLHICVL